MSDIHVRQGLESDWQVVYALLARHEMEAEVDPAEFFLAISGEHLVGAVRLEWEAGEAYVRPLVVDSSWQGRGVGSLLLQFLAKEIPRLNVVARGQVTPFYEKIGFIPLAWEQVPPRYRAECESCPDQTTCNPVSMTLGVDREDAGNRRQN